MVVQLDDCIKFEALILTTSQQFGGRVSSEEGGGRGGFKPVRKGNPRVIEAGSH